MNQKLTMPPTNKEKEIIKYAVCFALNKKCLSGDIQLFQTRAKAKQYIYELHCEAGGFEDDHHIIRVLITPIKNDKRRN